MCVPPSVARSLFHECPLSTFSSMKAQGDAGDFHGRRPTRTPWISCDMSRGRLTQVPALLPTLQSPPLFFAAMVVLTIDP